MQRAMSLTTDISELESHAGPQAGTMPSFGRLILLTLQDDFLKELDGKGRSLNTLKNYKTDLDCFNQYLSDKYPPHAIVTFDLEAILLYGKYLQVKYTSDNSRRRRVQTLRIFFDFLVSKHIFSSNPVRKIPSSPKFVDEPRPAPFSEVKTFWHCLLQEEHEAKMTRLSGQNISISELLSKRNQILIILIFGAGLKVSDVSPLGLRDLILGESPRVMVKPAKRDPYSIPLHPSFSNIIDDYLKHLEQLKAAFNIQFDQAFFNANPYKILSGGLSPRGIEIVFEEYRKKLMIQTTPKSLRQACVFKWIGEKIPDSVIKEWMGVAPSYDLSPYKDKSLQFLYSENALAKISESYLENRPSAH